MMQNDSMFFEQDPAQREARFLILLFVLMLVSVTGLQPACAQNTVKIYVSQDTIIKSSLEIIGDTVVNIASGKTLTLKENLVCNNTDTGCSLTIEGSGTMIVGTGLKSSSLTISEGTTLQVNNGSIEITNTFTNNGGIVKSANSAAGGNAVSAGSLVMTDGEISAAADKNAVYCTGNVEISGGKVTTDHRAFTIINSGASVMISGGTVDARELSQYRGYGIYASDSVTISSAAVNVYGSTFSVIHAENGDITIGDGAEVDANGSYDSSASYGISAEKGNITISGAKVKTSGFRSGIYAKAGNIAINGGADVSGYTHSSGYNDSIVIYAKNDITINQCKKVTADLGYLGIRAGSTVSISGCEVQASNKTGGIASDGSVIISGKANVTAAVTGISDQDSGNAIYAKDNCEISGSSEVTIGSSVISSARGIFAKTFSISGGKLTAKTEKGSHGLLISGAARIKDNAEVEIAGFEYGIESESESVTISSGKAAVEAGTTGIRASNADNNGKIEIKDSTVSVKANKDAVEADIVDISGGKVTAVSEQYGINAEDGGISLRWKNADDFIYASSYSGSTETGKRFIKYNGKPDAAVAPAGIVPAGVITDTTAIDGFTLRPMEGFCVLAYDGVQVREAAVTIGDSDHKTYCEYGTKDSVSLIPPVPAEEKWKKISAAAAGEPAKAINIDPKDFSVSMPEDDLIVRMANAAVSIDPIIPQIYTGSGIEPVVSVKEKKGSTEQVLTENTDYAVNYEDNRNAGDNSASAIVSGKGIYFGEETVKFTIKPKGVTVTAKPQTIEEGESIKTGTGQAELSGAAAGHMLSAVTLTADEAAGTISPSDAKIAENSVTGKGTEFPDPFPKNKTDHDVTHNYSITYRSGKLTVQAAISYQVTFTVVNGFWDDGTDEDIIVTLTGFEGDELKLSAANIPAAGNSPAEGYEAGSWDPVPEPNTAVTDDLTFTYTYTESEPEPEPETEPEPGINFFRIFAGCELPATGFSTLRHTVMPEQPQDLHYEPLQMRIQIPSLNVETELVTIPRKKNSWEVRWLDDGAGLLEGSALPGEGYAVVAAHNTLNDTEYGPFALLGTLKTNDLITVNAADESMRLFRVYANELVEPDGLAVIGATARQEAGSLILLTCENEGLNGEYLDRRAVFAKPVK